MTLTFAVIPTHDRPAELLQTIASLGLPPDRVLVIDNASTPPVADIAAQVVRDEEQPPNISRLWNIGWTGRASRLPARSTRWPC